MTHLERIERMQNSDTVGNFLDRMVKTRAQHTEANARL